MSAPASVSGTRSTSNDAALVELVEEITNRLHAGEPVDLEACVAAHPEHADDLRQLLPALHVLAALSGSNGEMPRPMADSGSVHGSLGDFRIIREIGRGGMGVVYEAEQVSLRRRVALKVLPFAGVLDAKQLQRFQNEAQAAAHLHHTNIVPVHFVGNERGVHYYAMQLIDGCTLAEVIRELRQAAGLAPHRDKRAQDSKPLELLFGPIPRDQAAPAEQQPTTPYVPAPPTVPSETAKAAAASTERSHKNPAFFRTVAELGIQAAEALEYAHQTGVVHRDIKPANLLLDQRGNLWVTDFGLAQFQNGTELTMTGDVIGTLRFMSPEQALGKRVAIDGRTDVYSLGVTLYELLTLQSAYSGHDRQELLKQIAFEEPRSARRVNRAVPEELETILRKAMEKNPDDRYPTARALADDLRRYLMHEPIRARRSSLLRRARKVARRHPGVTLTASIAAVAGLLLGIAGLAVNNHLIRKEQLRTQDALETAEEQKAIAQTVRDFLCDKLLAQADARAQADALLRSGSKSASPKPNPTIHELLDRAAGALVPANIESQFSGQPLVQAEILKVIGETYRRIGEYGKAIPHLQRALDLQT
jgi:eukaryotic-like serine/threonine-protein kinase